MSFSSNFLGSILGKQSFFGTRKFGTNIYKNISFGVFQSIASISLASLIILSLNPRNGIPLLDISIVSFNNFLIGSLVLSIIVFIILFVRRIVKKKDLKILLFTYLRSVIYYLQYALVISLFYARAEVFMALTLVALYFLLKTLLPFMNIFGGIGTRELALTILFTQAGLNGSPIILGALLIWMSNFIFPNILGIVSIFKKGNCLAPLSS